MSHTHKFTLKRKYVHEQICPKEMFDPKSFRRVRVGGVHQITTGCPKKQFKKGRCVVGLRQQNLLHSVEHFKRKYPSKFKRLEYGKGVMLAPTKSAKKHYCPV
jgi:hypothetical protein